MLWGEVHINRWYIALALIAVIPKVLEGATTIDAAHPYAYSANAGWINAAGSGSNGAVIGPYYCTGFVWSANCGWIGLGKGPTNGWRYSNTSSNDWGLNHDGRGQLTGYAYGANVGWIVFEQTYGQPRLDLLTGRFSGFAYGANIGWISLSNALSFVRTAHLDTGPDSNGNGLPDAWELQKVGTLSLLSSNLLVAGKTTTGWDEYVADTDPTDTNDLLRITFLHVLQGTNAMVKWLSKPTRLYWVEGVQTLTNAAGWTDAANGVQTPDASGSTFRTLVGLSSTQHYIRVKSLVPLP